MKKIFITLCLSLLFAGAQADFLGIKQASESISFFLREPLDSLGLPRIPDSVHIHTYKDNASAATYTARSTTFPFSDVSIDTLKNYGDTLYVFADQIQDIDGAAANCELAIVVDLFCAKLPTSTRMHVQIVSDSLENLLSASKDSSSSAAVLAKNCRDSLQSQDGWAAKEATSTTINSEVTNLNAWNPSTDSTLSKSNVMQISGDATAADNLEAMLDGTRAKLYLSQLNILASGNDTGIISKGSGSGQGMLVFGGATGHAAEFRGGTTSGDAITTWTNNGNGMSLYGSKDKHGLIAQAGDSGCGIYAMGGDDANIAANAYGFYARGRVDDGMQITGGSGTNKHGIEIRGGTGSGGDAVRIVATSTTGDGIDISADDGRGIYLDATGGNGIELRGDTGLYVLGDVADIVGKIPDLDALIRYFGACDNCYQRLFPLGGVANKDSVIIIDPSLGADSLIAKIRFFHGTTPSVYDSAYFYIAPW